MINVFIKEAQEKRIYLCVPYEYKEDVMWDRVEQYWYTTRNNKTSQELKDNFHNSIIMIDLEQITILTLK